MTEQGQDSGRDAAEWRAKAQSDQTAIERNKPGCVEAYGYRVYSQSDEDGILSEIFNRIGVTNKIFVEFGAETGLQNNCRLLLEKGWKGLWIEGNPQCAAILRIQFAADIEASRLSFIESYIDRDNVNTLIARAGFPKDIDLFSLDIDGNDYHVWEALDVISPRVIVAEHNGYPPPQHFVMPYDPDHRWDFQSGDIGSSLQANVELARRKGYTLVATGVYSPNGFYVKDELLDGKFPGPFDATSNFRPGIYEALINFPGPPSAAAVGLPGALPRDGRASGGGRGDGYSSQLAKFFKRYLGRS